VKVGIDLKGAISMENKSAQHHGCRDSLSQANHSGRQRKPVPPIPNPGSAGISRASLSDRLLQ
jgi:hypothetical protein